MEFIKGTARTLAANLGKKWITDRQAQYMYREVLCPVLAYKMQGVVLSEEEIAAIQAQLMRMVKHKFGVPNTTPESFWFARSGGCLTCLHADYDRHAIEMTVCMCNGEGCTVPQPSEVGRGSRIEASKELAEAAMSRITGDSWWPNVTLILARRGINIGIPATGEVEDPSILSILTQINVLNHAHVGTSQPLMIKGDVARKVLEWPVNMPESTAELFLADEIARRFRGLDIAGLAASATQIEIYTDGSLKPGSARTPARMGFAAISQFHRAGETIKEVTVAGAMKDGPFSSTMAEIMAIVAVLAVLPSDAKATVWRDSQAAIAYTCLLQKKSDNNWRKSPQAYKAQFHVDLIRQRREPLKIKWVRGHKGNKGNKAADRAAKDAWSQPQGWWSLRLGSQPEQRFYLRVGTTAAAYRTGGIIKRQEEARAVQRLWKTLRAANPDADFTEQDLKETLEELNWSATDAGSAWIRKNSWCRMSTRDSNIRGFVLGAIFGLLPVALREWAFYPQAYAQEEWKMCPGCNREIETQAQFFACKESRVLLRPDTSEAERGGADASPMASGPTEVGTTPTARIGNVPNPGAGCPTTLQLRQDWWTLVKRMRLEVVPHAEGEERGETEYRAVPEESSESRGPIDQWIEMVASARLPYLGITRDWKNGSTTAIGAEMRQYGENGKSWLVNAVAGKKELKSAALWARVVRKVAIRRRWQKEHEEYWLPRNGAQIRKEEASDVQPQKKRRAMREPRPSDIVRDAGTPEYPNEPVQQKRTEYATLCKVLVGDWSRGVKSRVAGSGLWSVDTRFS
ncbi:hypothetical protein GGI17_004312 [Coemansia sp. S146]|nr:hypothetical protein GGI17_004312 [Coemansia sp. S146]